MIYCKTRIFSAQFILALLAHSFVCAKISSALNFHIVYVHKTYGDQYYGTPIPLNSVIGSTLISTFCVINGESLYRSFQL